MIQLAMSGKSQDHLALTELTFGNFGLKLTIEKFFGMLFTAKSTISLRTEAFFFNRKFDFLLARNKFIIIKKRTA